MIVVRLAELSLRQRRCRMLMMMMIMMIIPNSAGEKLTAQPSGSGLSLHLQLDLKLAVSTDDMLMKCQPCCSRVDIVSLYAELCDARLRQRLTTKHAIMLPVAY